MLGTLTLKGVQEKNIFVDEHGRTFHLANSWVIPPDKMKQYVLLKKFDENSWYRIRSLRIE
jgi:hypothetical protein